MNRLSTKMKTSCTFLDSPLDEGSVSLVVETVLDSLKKRVEAAVAEPI
jgi:hypothetical protein